MATVGKQQHATQPPLPPPQQSQQAPYGTWVMGTPVAPPLAQPTNKHAATWVPVQHVPAPVPIAAASAIPIYKNYSSPAPPLTGTTSAARVPAHVGKSNPYVHATPVPGSSGKSPMEMLLKMLDRCGRKLEDNARKAGVAIGNVWHHLRTSPSLGDAAMARLAQGTKVLAEGGHEKVFHQLFGTLPGEGFRKAYACYLSTSTGPVIGTIYISSARLAFCSDNPLCHNISPGQQEWIYYKVVIPLDQLKAVNPSFNIKNPADKYIQTVTADNHEFWFMGFVSYDKALKNLTEASQHLNANHSQKPHH